MWTEEDADFFRKLDRMMAQWEHQSFVKETAGPIGDAWREGRKAGLLHQIRFYQRLFKQPMTELTELDTMSLDDLLARASEMELQLIRKYS